MAEPRQRPQRPPGWQAEHAKRYLETDGADGHIWNDMPTLLLTTTGRRSGKPNLSPLIYGRDGERYLVIGSRGGAPKHPNWYLNLVAQAEVQVQVLGDRFRAHARTATPAEKAALWPIMTRIYATYDDYQAGTTRDIPLVIIERL